jgi:hypothetical protein
MAGLVGSRDRDVWMTLWSHGTVDARDWVDSLVTIVNVLDANTKVAKVEEIMDGWMGLGRSTRNGHVLQALHFMLTLTPPRALR